MNHDQSIVYATGKGLWVVADGMGSTMSVHENTIASDKVREANGQRLLTAPLAPGAETDVNMAGMLTINAHRYRPLNPPDRSDSLTLFQSDRPQGLAQELFALPPSVDTGNFPNPNLNGHMTSMLSRRELPSLMSHL